MVRAAPDGCTLLFCTSASAVNPALFDKMSFNFIEDLAPVAGVMLSPQVMSVHPSFPPRTVPEFLAYAKANPGKVNFGSGGTGSPGHVAGELLKMLTGIEMTNVSYRSAALALADVVGGQVQLAIVTTAASIALLRSASFARWR